MHFRFVLIAVLLAANMFGQSSTGTATMTRAVSDASGAVVQQAKVTVTNKDTGFVFTSRRADPRRHWPRRRPNPNAGRW
jgi:hypothetical protein